MMKTADPTTQFAEAVRTELENEGLSDAEYVSSSPVSTAFGNTAVIFRVGPLLIRISLERGERFVDIAAQEHPTKFYQFDDVAIAMGWRSIDAVLAKREPEPVGTILRCIRQNLDSLMISFSGDRERLTRERIEKAARERGQAFEARLRGM